MMSKCLFSFCSAHEGWQRIHSECDLGTKYGYKKVKQTELFLIQINPHVCQYSCQTFIIEMPKVPKSHFLLCKDEQLSSVDKCAKSFFIQYQKAVRAV